MGWCVEGSGGVLTNFESTGHYDQGYMHNYKDCPTPNDHCRAKYVVWIILPNNRCLKRWNKTIRLCWILLPLSIKTHLLQQT